MDGCRMVSRMLSRPRFVARYVSAIHGFFRSPSRARMFPIVLGVASLAFLLFPGSIDQKTQSALHGLCAQRPSHSFWFGETRLPFDARMTGIYGGFATSFAFLVHRGRLWALAQPSWTVLGLMLSFVGVMGIDGANSFLLDIGAWHPYSPQNDIRLITGLLTGIALAAIVCFLLSATLWRRGRRDLAVVSDPREVGILVAIQIPFALLVRWGPSWLYAPVALLLVLAATTVVAALALVMWTIATRQDGRFTSIGDLGGTATIALVLAIIVMGSIAGGRFWLEDLVGVPPLT